MRSRIIAFVITCFGATLFGVVTASAAPVPIHLGPNSMQPMGMATANTAHIQLAQNRPPEQTVTRPAPPPPAQYLDGIPRGGSNCRHRQMSNGLVQTVCGGRVVRTSCMRHEQGATCDPGSDTSGFETRQGERDRRRNAGRQRHEDDCRQNPNYCLPLIVRDFLGCGMFSQTPDGSNICCARRAACP